MRVGQLEHAFKGTDGQVVIRKHIAGIPDLFATAGDFVVSQNPFS